MVDPVAPTASQCVLVPIGVTGDAVPSIHTSDTESIVSREGHSDCEGDDQDPVPISDPPLPLCQFRVVGVRGCGVPMCEARMFDESSPRVEGSLPVSNAHRVGRDRRHSACVPQLEVVLVVAKVVAPDLFEGARFRKHSCNDSRVESRHLFWPTNDRVQPEEFRPLRVVSDVQSVTTRAGPPEPRRCCTWASYPQVARRSKVQPWHQGQTRRWPCFRTR